MPVSRFKLALLGAITTAAMAVSAPATALEIILNDIGGGAKVTGTAAELGFKIAARYWETVLTNNVTVQLNVGYGGLAPGFLGYANSSFDTFVPIADFHDALTATQTSALDATAVTNLSSLSATGSVNVLVSGYALPGFGVEVDNTRTAPDGRAISNRMALSTANSRAIGLDAGPGFSDGEVRFSNTFAFDFDPTDGITAGTFDFISIAVHEIGHVLGFSSAADDFDTSDGNTGSVDNLWWGYAPDLFRYSSPGQLDWQPNQPSYFSIDGGATALFDGYFSTGRINGDGNQAAHWKAPDPTDRCNNFRGIMNPYTCRGKGGAVTSLDLALMDAIGWNLNVDVLAHPGYAQSTRAMFTDYFGVPEPATWATMILGFGLAGCSLRRRKRFAH